MEPSARARATAAASRAAWLIPMRGRDPSQADRSATPLELFFDLTFVVAVAQAASELHHFLADGHVAEGLAGFVIVFFAIWWPWVNFTWFASAYDTDDVPYRLLTFVQMAGVLIVTAGIPAVFEGFEFSTMVAGYVVMRIALVAQWLRAARDDPERRMTALRFAIAIAAIQVGWAVRLAIGAPWGFVAFAALTALELLVPVWAERSGRRTPWHPEHIAERYGLFTIIVLGECILAATTATQVAVEAAGFPGDVQGVAVGGLVLVFALWWAYFKAPAHVEERSRSLRSIFIWSYGHFLVFATIAILGAGLQVAADATHEDVAVGPVTIALLVAVPAAVYLASVGLLHAAQEGGRLGAMIGVGSALLIAAALAAEAVGVAWSIVAMGLVVAGIIAVSRILAARDARRDLAAAEAADSGLAARSAPDVGPERSPG